MKFKNILLLLFVVGLISTSCTTPKSDDSHNQHTQVDDSKPQNVTDTQTKGNDDQKGPSMQRKVITDSVMMKRFDAALKEEPTAAQKATGIKICNCMNAVEIFSKVVKAKSQEEFEKLAGDDKYDEILEIQKCHYKIMKPAIKNLDKTEGGVYAYKTREYLEKQCMQSHPKMWFYIGTYITSHKSKK